MKDRYSYDWNDTAVDLLKTRVLDGMSASQIALSFGGKMTRNAVIGKCSRMGFQLKGRPSGQPRSPKPPKQKRTQRGFGIPLRPKMAKTSFAGNGMAFERAPDATPPKLRVVDATGTPATILDAGFGGCRWPINTPDQNDGASTLFCCGPRLPGRVYCEGHRAIAYDKPSEKRKRSALRVKSKVWA
jgi:hypothetical protein